MSAPSPTPPGQAPDAGQPQAGGTAPQAGDDGITGQLSLAELQAELAKTRREAAGHRARATELERKQSEAEAATLTEQQKIARERDSLKAELEAERLDRRAAINRYEVQLAASKLGIVDPEAAVKLMDWESLEYNEDGSPKGVEKALRALLAAKPYLQGQQQASTPGAATGNPARGNGTAPLTLKDLRGKPPAWINDPKNWPAVQEAMRRGI